MVFPGKGDFLHCWEVQLREFLYGHLSDLSFLIFSPLNSWLSSCGRLTSFICQIVASFSVLIHSALESSGSLESEERNCGRSGTWCRRPSIVLSRSLSESSIVYFQPKTVFGKDNRRFKGTHIMTYLEDCKRVVVQSISCDLRLGSIRHFENREQRKIGMRRDDGG